MAVPDRTEPAGRGRPGPEPQAPGWYRDPDQADQLRYWDGVVWTPRRRPRPAWSDGTPGVAPGDGTTGVPPGDGTPGVAPGDGTVPTTKSPRRKWLVLVVAAVVGATAVLVAGERMRPKSPGPRVLTDARYVRSASAECARTLPGLYPPDAGPFGQSAPPAQTADQIDRAAAGLDRLADRLRAVPASAADRPHIDAWLDGWHRYTGFGRRYAAFLRQHGNADPGRLLIDNNREAKVDDNFALANGLSSCTFFVTPKPDPSNGF